MYTDLVKKKAELAACREAEDKERQRQMEIDEALKSSKGATLPDHVRNKTLGSTGPAR